MSVGCLSAVQFRFAPVLRPGVWWFDPLLNSLYPAVFRAK